MIDPDDTLDLVRRVAELEAKLREVQARGDTRDDLELRVVELEAEIQALKPRIASRGRGRRPLLDDIRIASPCTADWAEMVGDDRVRHCKECRKSVFNLSAMTRREAEHLIAGDDAACIRLYSRPDGTVLTTDCPVGRRQLRVRNVIAATGTVAVFAALALIGADPVPLARPAGRGVGRAQDVGDRIAQDAKSWPQPADSPPRRVLMGGRAQPPVPTIKPPAPNAKPTAPSQARGGKSS